VACAAAAVDGLPIDFSPTDRSDDTSPVWFAILRFPFRWILFLVLPLFLIFGGLLLSRAASNQWCFPGKVRIGETCVIASALQSRQEIRERISTLVADSGEVLDIKQGTLLPLLRDYHQNEVAWSVIIRIVEKLKGRIDQSLTDVTLSHPLIF
jgi:hypothetical protein